MFHKVVPCRIFIEMGRISVWNNKISCSLFSYFIIVPFCCRFLLWQMVKTLKWVRKLHMLYFNLYASRLCSSPKNVLGMKKSIGFILRSLSPLVYTQQKSALMIYVHNKIKFKISVICAMNIISCWNNDIFWNIYDI